MLCRKRLARRRPDMLARCACRDRRLSHNIVLYTVVERAARVAPSRPLLEPTLGQGERGGSKALHISGQPDRFRCARCKTVVVELYFQALFFGLRTTRSSRPIALTGPTPGAWHGSPLKTTPHATRSPLRGLFSEGRRYESADVSGVLRKKTHEKNSSN